MKYDRRIEIHAGHDDRATGQGFACAELLFVLTDRERSGAATFAVRTNWLPLSMEAGALRPSASLQALDLTYHFATPTLTVDQDRRAGCPYLNGGDCHAITDHRNGPELIAVLQSGGSEAVWRWLEQHYREESRINNTYRKGVGP